MHTQLDMEDGLGMMPESTATERETLISRAIPHMTLSTGGASSMTGPPLPVPHYLSNDGRAVMRFAIEGNAISMSTCPGVLIPAVDPRLARTDH